MNRFLVSFSWNLLITKYRLEAAYICRISDLQRGPVRVAEGIPRAGTVMTGLEVILRQGIDGQPVGEPAGECQIQRLPVVARFGKNTIAGEIGCGEPVDRLLVAARKSDAVGKCGPHPVEILQVVLFRRIGMMQAIDGDVIVVPVYRRTPGFTARSLCAG